MEITVKELPHTDVITLRGRLERSTAAQLTEVLADRHQLGRSSIILDLQQVEYISSSGFRALLNAQRRQQHDRRGELILTQVPAHIREALELTGITQLFRTFDDLSSALAYAAALPGDPTTDAPPPKKTK